jgi:hypothetical protein
VLIPHIIAYFGHSVKETTQFRCRSKSTRIETGTLSIWNLFGSVPKWRKVRRVHQSASSASKCIKSASKCIKSASKCIKSALGAVGAESGAAVKHGKDGHEDVLLNSSCNSSWSSSLPPPKSAPILWLGAPATQLPAVWLVISFRNRAYR